MLRRSFLGLMALVPWVGAAKAFDRFRPRANEYRGLTFRGDAALEDGATYFECTFDTGRFSGQRLTLRNCRVIDTVWAVDRVAFIDCHAESRRPSANHGLLVDAGGIHMQGNKLYWSPDGAA